MNNQCWNKEKCNCWYGEKKIGTGRKKGTTENSGRNGKPRFEDDVKH